MYQNYNSKFGPGTGPIFFDDLTCDGTERSIKDCSSSSPHPESCYHGQDVGVRCEEIAVSGMEGCHKLLKCRFLSYFLYPVHEECTDGDVRLAGGENENEGRVELCIGNVWGSVCDDSWSINDGTVICHQLGYQETSNTLP